MAAMVASVGAGVASDYLFRGGSNTKETSKGDGSAPVTEKGFYTAEIANAVRTYYANLRNLRDMLDVNVTVTDTEMMNGLLRPFSDMKKSVREELAYLSPEKREAEVQKRREQHIGVQASLQDALVLYMAVEHQLAALHPLVRYKGLTPPLSLPAPQAAAGSAGAVPTPA